jgi:transaldolase/glucose-6-phosphate isomerase
VPVDLEPVRDVDAYGADRAFVDLSLAGDEAGAGEARAARQALLGGSSRGSPGIRIELDDPIDLAGEAIRWEVATAFAGAVLGIDPFDQPNVEEAKELTRQVLAGHATRPARSRRIRFRRHLPARPRRASLAEALRTDLARPRVPRYLAIQAFITPSAAVDERIAAMRAALAATGCATTAGYGPRFLHSDRPAAQGRPADRRVPAARPSDHPGIARSRAGRTPSGG